MNEIYSMSKDIHILGVIGLIIVLIIMMFLHKKEEPFQDLIKRIRVLMIFHISFASSLVLTGSIMMATKHLSFTPANLLMIISIFVIAMLESKRHKALKMSAKFKQIPQAEYKKIAYKYQFIELLTIVCVGAFAGMAG